VIEALLDEPSGRIAPVKTDSEGRFSFASLVAGNYKLTALAREYLPMESRAAGRTPIDLTLRPGERLEALSVRLVPSSRLSGFVSGPGGGPVIASLTLLQADSKLVYAQTRSSSDGAFAFSDLPQGSYLLSAIASDGLAAHTSPLQIAVGEARRSDLTLNGRSFLVRGQIEPREANAVLPAQLNWLVERLPSARSSPVGSFPPFVAPAVRYSPAAGTFEMRVLPGVYRITSSSPDFVWCSPTAVVVVQDADVVSGLTMQLFRACR
jgi:hypothetical protein